MNDLCDLQQSAAIFGKSDTVTDGFGLNGGKKRTKKQNRKIEKLLPWAEQSSNQVKQLHL